MRGLLEGPQRLIWTGMLITISFTDHITLQGTLQALFLIRKTTLRGSYCSHFTVGETEVQRG